jgi:hypothetical protein
VFSIQPLSCRSEYSANQSWRPKVFNLQISNLLLMLPIMQAAKQTGHYALSSMPFEPLAGKNISLTYLKHNFFLT